MKGHQSLPFQKVKDLLQLKFIKESFIDDILLSVYAYIHFRDSITTYWNNILYVSNFINISYTHKQNNHLFGNEALSIIQS